MPPHPYGMLSLLPPVVAIVLAIATRQAVISLLAGLACGALLTAGGHPLVAAHDLLEVHLWPAFVDEGKLRIFSFTLLMGAMIGVISRCGGMQGFVRLIAPLARSRRGGQLTTWLLGLAIFFDDYANTMLLGNTLRPLCDRLKISREKLAYLVDSTAAPVAGISLLSTWVAVEIDYIQEGLLTLGSPAQLQAFDLFVASIPYRFYVLGSLMLIPLIAISGRDFGAMLRAERKRLAPDYDPAETDYAARLDIDEEIRPSHWLNAVLPISVTLLGVVLLLYRTGSDALAERTGGQAETSLRDIFGAADSSLALQYGALAGLLLAAGLSWMQRLLTGQQIVDAMRRGAGVVLPAIAILWCASSLSRMTGNRNLEGVDSLNDRGQETFAYRDHRLYTGDYLTGLIAGGQQTATGQGGESGAGVGAESTLRLLPTLVFLLASIVAFCTGTSFGTMGILVPMVITLTHALLASRGSPVTADDPILLATIGSVLAGAVFGDHCSPISDTTILSSQSCACDHIAHVMTQLPYALTVATMAVLLGTLPIGWGVSVWILLPLQALALAAIVWRVGKPCEESAPRPEA